MKLQDQVCTLEQAKQLRELGVSQDSLFSWCGDETNRLMDGGASGVEYGKWVFVNTTKSANNQEEDHRDLVPSAKPFAAAFTVAELGVMLPTLGIKRVKSNNGQGQDYHWLEFKSQDWSDINEAQLLSKFLIYLLEEKIITPEEVNNRLSN